MAEAEIELVAPCEELREALIEYIEEFHQAGEHYWQGSRDLVRRDFGEFLRQRRNAAWGLDLAEGHVPWLDYWLVRGRRVLGSARFRHRLTPALEIEGGHIGYEVRPSERGKGYAKRLLAMLLGLARQFGHRRVLVTCDKDNLASARVIQSNGGVLDSEVASPRSGKPVQRYWIEVRQAEAGAGYDPVDV